MKLTTFSFLQLLMCTYAVMVDREKKGNLRDVLQNNNDESYFLNKKINMIHLSGAATSDGKK